MKWLDRFKKKKQKLKMHEAHDVVYYRGRKRMSYGLTKERAGKISINTMKRYLDKYKPLN